MNRPSWERRIERAGELAQAHPFAVEVLAFYREIAAFQRTLYSGRKPVAAFPSLVDLVERCGTAELAEAGNQLCRRGRPYWEQLLEDFWTTRQSASDAEAFFAKALLEPYAEYLADHAEAPPETYSSPVCPVCAGKPVAGVLRPQGHGARRFLLCALCWTEWNFPRVLCPACGEQSFEALPVYTASQFDCVRVDACDRCMTYLKTVDLSKNGLAVPVVDELAAIPLDLRAQEMGYAKLQRNLFGV